MSVRTASARPRTPAPAPAGRRPARLLAGLVLAGAALGAAACQPLPGQPHPGRPGSGPHGTAPATTATTTPDTSAPATSATSAPDTSAPATPEPSVPATLPPPGTPGTTAPHPTVGPPVLHNDALGDVAFGTPRDAALARLRTGLGPYALPELQVCADTTAVDWRDLDLQAVFRDGALVGWRAGLRSAGTGVRTDAGVAVGQTIAEARAADPGLSFTDPPFPNSFILDGADRLHPMQGRSTGSNPRDRVEELRGGFFC